jgi:acetyltransferase-like isoleucine patch superfamily enzyme
VDETVAVFPPLHSDFGRNRRIGRRVFINSDCRFQDQGGVVIGDDCNIGHNAVFATPNHDLDPEHRADMLPAPITLGRTVWLGANVTVLPGVSIGDNAVVWAGSVVTEHVPAITAVVGSPAPAVLHL